MVYIPIILVAGLLFGSRMSIGVAAASILSGLALDRAEALGLFKLNFDPVYKLWLDQSLNIVLTTLLFALALNSLEKALADSRRNAQALAERNQDLQREIADRVQAEESLRLRTAQLDALRQIFLK